MAHAKYNGEAPLAALASEASFVASFIYDADIRTEAALVVPVEILSSASNRTIYEAALQMHLDGKPIDLVTVCGELERQGRLAGVGGAEYVAKVYNDLPTPASWRQYAQDVRDAAFRRGVVQSCTEIINSVKAGGERAERVTLSSVINKLVASVSFDANASALRHLEEYVDAAVTPPKRETVKATGIGKIDSEVNLIAPGRLTILAGRASVGKSSFMRQMILAGSEIGKVLVFTLEVPAVELVSQLACEAAKVSYDRFSRGLSTKEEQERVALAGGNLMPKPIYISPSSNISALDVTLAIKAHSTQGKIALVAIDYLGIMRHEKAERRDLEISGTTRALKLAANSTGVPILLLCQLNRDVEKRGSDSECAPPRLSDLRESGAIEQDADNVCFLWRRSREAEHMPIESIAFRVAKRRQGPTFEVDLKFKKQEGRFEEMEPEPTSAKQGNGWVEESYGR